MLTNSFIFLDGIGKESERRIWRQGILCWNDFSESSDVSGLSKKRKAFYDLKLRKWHQALLHNDAYYYSQNLDQKYAWRLWEHLKQDAVFLDIETTGGYGNITVIGLYDGLDTKIMVRGFNLNKELLRRELEQYDLIVTFNGASFDLPVIKRYFGSSALPKIPHIDLRGVCSQVGLKGGLKSIEQQIGIKRPDDILYVYGDDAAFLWHKWQATGDKQYLDILIRYNEEDIINLKPLAEHAISRLWENTFGKKILVECLS